MVLCMCEPPWDMHFGKGMRCTGEEAKSLLQGFPVSVKGHTWFGESRLGRDTSGCLGEAGMDHLEFC